jgi:hypothetical protein
MLRLRAECDTRLPAKVTDVLQNGPRCLMLRCELPRLVTGGPPRQRRWRDYYRVMVRGPRLLGHTGFGGSLFQFPALAAGLDAAAALFPVALRLNAELVPIRLRKIDIIVLYSTLQPSRCSRRPKRDRHRRCR